MKIWPSFSDRSRDVACHGSQFFKGQSRQNWPTRRSLFVALALRNEMEYRNADRRVNSSDDLATPDIWTSVHAVIFGVYIGSTAYSRRRSAVMRPITRELFTTLVLGQLNLLTISPYNVSVLAVLSGANTVSVRKGC